MTTSNNDILNDALAGGLNCNASVKHARATEATISMGCRV
jgi:hypothetical protein